MTGPIVEACIRCKKIREEHVTGWSPGPGDGYGCPGFIVSAPTEGALCDGREDCEHCARSVAEFDAGVAAERVPAVEQADPIWIGTRLATQIFENRVVEGGNRALIRLTREELAAMLALAADRALSSVRR